MTDTHLKAAGDGLPDGHQPLTTKEGWRRFVDQPADAPDQRDPVIVGAQDAALVEDARLAHHSRLAVVATPTVRQVTPAGAGWSCSTATSTPPGAG